MVGEEGTSTQKDLPDDTAFEPGLDSGVGFDQGVKKRKKNNSDF